MTNREVTDVLRDVQALWIRWRDDVPHRDSDGWDALVAEADAIKARYGTHPVRKWEGPAPVVEEEPVAAPVVNWFLDLLEAREREKYGKE